MGNRIILVDDWWFSGDDLWPTLNVRAGTAVIHYEPDYYKKWWVSDGTIIGLTIKTDGRTLCFKKVMNT